MANRSRATYHRDSKWLLGVFNLVSTYPLFSNEWCPNVLIDMMASHIALHFKYMHTFLTFQHFNLVYACQP